MGDLLRDLVAGAADAENLAAKRARVVHLEPHLRFTMLHLQRQEGSAFRQFDSEGVAEKYRVFVDSDHFSSCPVCFAFRWDYSTTLSLYCLAVPTNGSSLRYLVVSRNLRAITPNTQEYLYVQQT